ncbi:hypothetical protein Tco_0400993 [Tanacetum coccineum]
MHERPTGKIGVYTRFFEFSNFWLPLSTFLVDVLRKRSNSSGVCYTEPVDLLKHWNDHFFWVDAFACLVSYPWHTNKNISRDPLPKSTEFNVDHYAFLIAHPAPFQKFPEPFLCLIWTCLLFTKVKIDERERAEGEKKLLESIIGRVVPLLPVAPARSKSDLEASMDRLFGEGDSTDQGDSAASGGHDVAIEPVTDVEDAAAENLTTKRPKRHRKKKPAATDASGSSHPPKKLRGDPGTSSGVATGGKSSSVIKELLASSILNAKVDVKVMATLPFVTSPVSVTPEPEGGDPTDSVTGANLRTIGPAERFNFSPDSSHHSSTHASEAEVNSIIRSVTSLPVMIEAVITTTTVSAPTPLVLEVAAKITPQVQHSIFHESSSAGTIRPDIADPSHLPGKDLSMGSREINFKTFHEVFVLQWNASNDSLLDDHDTSWEFIDHFVPPCYLLKSARWIITTCLRSLMLGPLCERQADLLKARDEEIESLKAQLLLKEVEAAEAARLCIQVSVVEAAEKAHADELNSLKHKSVVHALETTCFVLRDQISGSLADVAAYNPAAEADFNSALQRLREVDFPLLVELKSHKDASVEDIMNLLCLEGPLVDAPGMNDLQPDVEQVMLPIHRPKDQVILGETSLSFALGVSHSRIEKIRENVAAQRSALVDVWVPVAEPLSAKNLTGAASTSNSVSVAVATTTALSTTFASTILFLLLL